MSLIVKVLCGQCGDNIGEVHREPAGIRYRPLWRASPGVTKPQPGDSISSARFWCADHGWTDPAEIAAAIDAAPDGRVTTHRARLRERHA